MLTSASTKATTGSAARFYPLSTWQEASEGFPMIDVYRWWTPKLGSSDGNFDVLTHWHALEKPGVNVLTSWREDSLHTHAVDLLAAWKVKEQSFDIFDFMRTESLRVQDINLLRLWRSKSFHAEPFDIFAFLREQSRQMQDVDMLAAWRTESFRALPFDVLAFQRTQSLHLQDVDMFADWRTRSFHAQPFDIFAFLREQSLQLQNVDMLAAWRTRSFHAQPFDFIAFLRTQRLKARSMDVLVTWHALRDPPGGPTYHLENPPLEWFGNAAEACVRPIDEWLATRDPTPEVGKWKWANERAGPM